MGVCGADGESAMIHKTARGKADASGVLDRRNALSALATAALAGAAPPVSAEASSRSPAPQGTLRLDSKAFRLDVDTTTGGVSAIRHPDDPAGMSWISGPENAPWHRAEALWGLGFADLGGARLHRGRWSRPTEVRKVGDAVEVVYQIGALTLNVQRRLAGATVTERYVFTNTGEAPLKLGGRERLARLAIYAPFNDHYTGTADVLEHRAHAHVWTGGAAAWVASIRMGGRAPHLGLVVNEGALDAYSIEDRDEVTGSNTRGTIMLHPAIDALAPGESKALAWTLFWHGGWDDFFSQALRHSRQMVAIEASRWTASPGETVDLTFAGDLGPTPTLSAEGGPITLTRAASGWKATLPAGAAREQTMVLRHGEGVESRLVLNTVPVLDDLIAARVRFITGKQQWARAGDPWDGAYIVYDNETNVMIREPSGPKSDRNDGRERVGMGVLTARWLRQGGRAEPAARASLDRYYRFVREQLQRQDGYVLDGSGRQNKRLYNWPWVMQLHLEMAALSGEPAPLDAFLATLESFYREGGVDFYPIGLPIADGLAALKAAGRSHDHDRALPLFGAHGRAIVARDIRYPASEVNFEQSIVAPAALILLELHRATGETTWLDAAKPHLAYSTCSRAASRTIAFMASRSVTGTATGSESR